MAYSQSPYIDGKAMEAEVEAFFAESGPLAKAKPGYKRRPSQVELALATLRSLQEGGPLLADAPPGSGKSFGYLVPAALWSARSGHRIAVSTATIALQSQLLEEDLPTLAEAMRSAGYKPPSYALAKGRSNFLCEARLENALGGDASDGSSGGSQVGHVKGTKALTETPSLFGDGSKSREASAIDDETLNNLSLFRHTAETGDKEEVFFPIAPFQWREVAADADDCAPKSCPFKEGCFYYNHIENALNAQIMVVNHALYFASLLGKGSLDMESRHVILDEAHRVEETLRESQSIRVTEGRAKYVARAARKRSRGLSKASDKLEDAGSEFFANLANRAREIPRKSLLAGDIGLPPAGYNALLSALRQLAADAGESGSDEVKNCRAMAESLIKDLGSFYGGSAVERREDRMQSGTPARILEEAAHSQTIETDDSGKASLRSWPIEVGPVFQSRVLKRGEEKQSASGGFKRPLSTILTSATLATGSVGKGAGSSSSSKGSEDPFRHVKACLALDGDGSAARTLKLPEGFDHDSRSLLYIERDISAPSYGAGAAAEDRHYDQMAARVSELVRASEGRALVLCSSNRSVAALKERLGESLEAGDSCTTSATDAVKDDPVEDISVSYQHDASITALVWWLKTSPRAVLVGTRTFWEGVDIPGEALSMVIIEKIPFPSPSDPVVAALSERAGKRWFGEVSLPRAQITLRQGAGRLLRAESDRGVIAILDTRVADKPWGSALLTALPHSGSTSDMREVQRFLQDGHEEENAGAETSRERGEEPEAAGSA